jgi:hypothetical protein
MARIEWTEKVELKAKEPKVKIKKEPKVKKTVKVAKKTVKKEVKK